MESDLDIYELQLSQVQLEITHCSDDSKKSTLRQLENDIKELIQLTRNTQSDEPQQEDPLDAEYNLFREELALDEVNAEANGEQESNTLDELQGDLESLPGMKCQAPFKHSWCEEPVFHNALVFKVEKSEEINSADDICVRVMFTNPTHIDMKPCTYLLEGECRFTKENCRFSHGEVVSLISLKEYKEPNFEELQPGSRALVKQDDGLWSGAIVKSVDDGKCVVKLESNSKEQETDLQNVFPLDGSEKQSNLEEESSSDDNSVGPDNFNTQLDVIGILHQIPASCAMGSWEQFTTGFGSRIMAKLGYVHGAGLGAKADGRVDPVPAVVYPSGKSIDHCMMLKEKAGGDQDLFKADRKMKRQQKKHEDAMSRAYEKEKQRTDVFTFLNNRLGQEEKVNPAGSNCSKKLQTATQKGLNVSSLQIAEDVKKIEKEKRKLNESLGRHSTGTPAHSTIKEKIRECDIRLAGLQESERKISTELQQRNDRKKLSVF